MRIRHNLSSVTALRYFGNNQGELCKNLEKLSSGFKINKAGDDAAGLAVSESMRERIKGLDQGHNNIDDGISLIQTADGAMAEITEILQRISKLSVQAANGTYSEDNRREIQNEIKELKVEIIRITDDTEFNDIKILKQSNEDKYVNYTKDLPDWLKAQSSSEMSINNVSGLNFVQDQDAYFVKRTNNTSPETYDYYGPDEKYARDSNYTYKGTWTPELNDNLSAIIDFSGLMTKYDGSGSLTAKDLYNDVFDLLGSSIGMSCATCNATGVAHPQYYGVAFYGSARDLDSGDTCEFTLDSMRYSSGKRVTGNAIDLGTMTLSDDTSTTVFDYLSYLVDSNADQVTLSEAAKTVANRLYSKTYESLSGYVETTDHYNRMLDMNADGNTPAIAIYDYRDVGSLDSYSSVSINSKTTGTYIKHPEKFWIQCSSVKDDRIPLDLPYLDLDELGIKNFSVDTYKTTRTPIYSPEDLAKLDDPANYEITHHSVPYQAVVGTTTNGNGETVYVYETRYREYDTKRYIGPAVSPTGYTTTSIYAPSNVQDIKYAIDKISYYRARLGAQQNRLEHSRNNNETMDENITGSESRIRDTNMAEEMSKYEKNTILIRSAQSVLGQIDKVTQGMMKMIEGL
ncbi:MAG: hypothetical protein E7232_00210 [Lachnospiraceae bacterium]|jgi:flagellin|nr:hypothetical protein [Lachnospiraceae bacterium]